MTTTATRAGTLPPRRRGGSRCCFYSLVGQNRDTVVWKPLRCKSWGCESCRVLLANRWAKTLGASDHFRPNLFLTITLDPQQLERLGILHDYRAQHRWFTKRVQALIKRARRIGQVRYFRVYEFHAGRWDRKRKIRNNRLHMHLLVDAEIPGGGWDPQSVEALTDRTLPRYDPARDWWRQNAMELGFGWTQGITVHEDIARTYVLKYTTKQKPGCYQWKVRIVATSRDIKHEPFGKDDSLTWTVWDEPADNISRRARRWGFDIEQENDTFSTVDPCAPILCMRDTSRDKLPGFRFPAPCHSDRDAGTQYPADARARNSHRNRHRAFGITIVADGRDGYRCYFRGRAYKERRLYLETQKRRLTDPRTGTRPAFIDLKPKTGQWKECPSYFDR